MGERVLLVRGLIREREREREGFIGWRVLLERGIYWREGFIGGFYRRESFIRGFHWREGFIRERVLLKRGLY